MPKISITISRTEIEQAVRTYVEDRIRGAYSHEFTEPSVAFLDANGRLGNFDAYYECEIEKAE